MLTYDTELFLLLNNLGNESWDGFWLVVTEKWSSIPLYALLLYLIYRNLGPKGTLIVLLVVAAMITATDQLANLFKYGIQRPRPCRLEALQDQMRFVAHGCGRFGFFSAHAANSMATAVFVGLLLRPYYRWLVFVLLLWSSVVAYSRIYLGVHYPLDIVTGMAVGGLLGFAFYRLNLFLQARWHDG